MAGEAGSPRTGFAVPPQPDRGGQCRRPHEAPGHGQGGRGRGHPGEARFRPLGADLLRRIRRPAEETGAREDYWRMTPAIEAQSQMTNEPNLVLLAGPNGAGKTTASQDLLA